MAERTLSQITKEFDQLASEINSLETQIEAKRAKLTDLVREQIEMQSYSLQRFGMKLTLDNARDGLPVEKSAAAATRRKTGGAASPGSNISREERERNAAARKWGIDTGWKDQNEKPVQAKGPMPHGLLDAFLAAQGQN